jgi:hypothetical protein
VCRGKTPVGTSGRSAVVEPLRREAPPCISPAGTGQRQYSRVRLGTSSVWFTCRMVCRTWNPAALTAGFPLLPASRHNTRSHWAFG